MENPDRPEPDDEAPPTIQGRRHWSRRQRIRYALLAAGAVILTGGTVIFAAHHISKLIRQNRLDPRFRPVARVDLKRSAASSDGHLDEGRAAGPTLRVAIAPVISPEKSLQMYQGLVDYLAEKLDREPVFLQGGSYEQVNELVRNHQCHVALVCTYAFIRGEEEFGMEAITVPVIGGEDHYHSYIIVPQSSPATSLLDLRGKRFGSANRLSNSGYLYPMVWLGKNGEDSKTFFAGNHVITGSHDRSVRHVVSQRVDGAAVDSLVYDQMVKEDASIGKQTKIIDVSPEYGMPPVVVPPQLSLEMKEMREELLSLLLEMHESKKGRDVLDSLGFDRFIRPRDGLFESVRENSAYLESRQ